MKYRYILTYQATDSETTATRTCFPLHGDDLSITIDREQDEWYYTRNLDGKLVFVNADYQFVVIDCPFDGTFRLDIQESHDGGATYYDYFSATFSRASLEIDEDNRTATLNGLKESIEDLIKNGAKEDYDLIKLIPDSYAKEVQGQVPPALVLVDYNSDNINKSDIFCGDASTGNGYKSGKNDYNTKVNAGSNFSWQLISTFAEAQVKATDQEPNASGRYSGTLNYRSTSYNGRSIKSIEGRIYNENNYWIRFNTSPIYSNDIYGIIELYNNNGYLITSHTFYVDDANYYTPSSLLFTDFGIDPINEVEIYFHYIRASLLTQSGGMADNVIDTGEYYKRMAFFINTDDSLQTSITSRTVEQPNGHRMVPGSDEYGGTPQYFAPPDDTGEWIPLAEDNWNFASMWYKIQPSVTNGLSDPDKYGSFAWTRCWTIGCCIQHLLDRITDGKVVFAENPDYSQFLYGNPNPVEDREPFQWLVTQKSNVMHPAAGGAARCPVRLDWFFELLRNAFNCYYWFEKRNDGRYDFRIEHVEYFRRGGAYQDDLADQLDLTVLKPVRNFQRNGIAAKRYADQTNRYTFDLDGMVEKYTYSWQGDGGGDDFKGNPMYFRAGWIEKGSSEDRQVDNIFADLGWLMLNAGTATESSKNYDGLFIFGGYQALVPEEWRENSAPLDDRLTLATDTMIDIDCDVWLTIPSGQIVSLELKDTSSATPATVLTQYTGTGEVQILHISYADTFNDAHALRLYFGSDYADVIIQRIHSNSGNVFRVPNVDNLLRDDDSKLQNGVLAWPWLQVEYLHYDIPAAKWTYLKDEYTDNPDLVWETDGTIKMVKKQDLAVVPVPDASTEDAIVDIMGVKTGLGIGIIDNAKINLSSRNAEMTIIYDINPQNN